MFFTCYEAVKRKCSSLVSTHDQIDKNQFVSNFQVGPSGDHLSFERYHMFESRQRLAL
jgi:hypothetical protein